MIEIISELSHLLPGQILSGSELGDKYTVDWSGESPLKPQVVVRIKTVADVSKLLAYCSEKKLAVVTQGGMTGLSGGSTPQASEIVLSLELLSGITDIDVESMTLIAIVLK